MKKSYHSSDVPIRLARMTRRTDDGGGEAVRGELLLDMPSPWWRRRRLSGTVLIVEQCDKGMIERDQGPCYRLRPPSAPTQGGSARGVDLGRGRPGRAAGAGATGQHRGARRAGAAAADRAGSPPARHPAA